MALFGCFFQRRFHAKPHPHGWGFSRFREAALVSCVFHFKPNVRCRLLADIVAKRFFASRRVTLIQEIDLSRKIDSSGAPVGFESCALGGGCRLPITPSLGCRRNLSTQTVRLPLTGLAALCRSSW
jgi:hypothetical protein